MAKKDIVKQWEAYATKHLLGKTIKKVRYMEDVEQEALGFFRKALVLELDDGTLLFPAADDEGNDAGALFGMSGDDEQLTFPVI